MLPSTQCNILIRDRNLWTHRYLLLALITPGNVHCAQLLSFSLDTCSCRSRTYHPITRVFQPPLLCYLQILLIITAKRPFNTVILPDFRQAIITVDFSHCTYHHHSLTHKTCFTAAWYNQLPRIIFMGSVKNFFGLNLHNRRQFIGRTFAQQAFTIQPTLHK